MCTAKQLANYSTATATATLSNFSNVSLENVLKLLHARQGACLPGTPCLLARDTRLGGMAFHHVNGSCLGIPANRGEISRENMAARGEFFPRYH